MQIFKLILAVFVGVFVGALAVWFVEVLGQNMYPPPPNFNFEDKEALAQHIAYAPLGAKLFVVLAYAIGAFLGGLLTQLISQSKKLLPSLFTGAILLGAGILNLTAIAHPTWMIVASVLVFLPFAYFGGWLLRKKPILSA